MSHYEALFQREYKTISLPQLSKLKTVLETVYIGSDAEPYSQQGYEQSVEALFNKSESVVRSTANTAALLLEQKLLLATNENCHTLLKKKSDDNNKLSTLNERVKALNRIRSIQRGLPAPLDHVRKLKDIDLLFLKHCKKQKEASIQELANDLEFTHSGKAMTKKEFETFCTSVFSKFDAEEAFLIHSVSTLGK